MQNRVLISWEVVKYENKAKVGLSLKKKKLVSNEGEKTLVAK